MEARTKRGAPFLTRMQSALELAAIVTPDSVSWGEGACTSPSHWHFDPADSTSWQLFPSRTEPMAAHSWTQPPKAESPDSEALGSLDAALDSPRRSDSESGSFISSNRAIDLRSIHV